MHRTGHANRLCGCVADACGWMDAWAEAGGVGFVVECHMRNQHSSRVLSSLLVR